ncbi:MULTISPECIES: GNAT family protein [Paenibacillus]|uniref:GNAT family N-acetyltransferase n=1 Tax=Paenibacillus TaxID=44249 RepID=UPI0004704A0D|nr:MULTISPECIES: GNAT family protein [Paenibacillus]APB73912.1 50S ribosomal protein L7/L12-serine acetyltransferase [Paenibacillus polymyxa]QYK64463.1 Putative ribosomal N-acetyltransferase YdaF [Paenibacillus sp. S25]
MFTYALDERTVLRPLTKEHVQPLFELIEMSRDRLRQWLPWVDSTTEISHTEQFVQGALKQAAENGSLTAGIWIDNELAGIISYHEINWTHRSVSIGYWLGHGYEGQGLMTSACRVFVEYALMELNLHRVEIRCATTNRRSRGIPERLGFVLEGIVREAELLPDGYMNHAVYGMLQNEWKQLR